MGTTWSAIYLSRPGTPEAAALQQRLADLLERVNASMSTYREDSEIQRINRAPVGQWIPVSALFFDVLSTAVEVGRESGGAYDVSVGPLVDLWGFGPGGRRREPPSPAEIEAVRGNVGQRYLELDTQEPALRKLRSLRLDFSSVAKGYAVDVLADHLLGQQIDNFLVEVGGEMRLSGHSPRGDHWRVAIERPETGGRAVARTVALSDVAVATSGDYRNFFEVAGRRYSHSIDPRTGYPVSHDLVSVTVLAATAMEADAWATALIVLGAERAAQVAQAQDLAVYFIRREGEGFVASHTPAFAPYLESGR